MSFLQFASVIVTISSILAATIPRTTKDGRESRIHLLLDLAAINVLHSAHNVGLANNISEKGCD
jgi:hypothetical protein